MKRTIFMSLLSFISFLGCSMTNQINKKEFKVIYFDKNYQENVKINNSDSFYMLIDSLISGVDDSFKLIVTNDKIKEIKDNDSGIEIFFSNEVSFDLKIGQTIKLKKLLIPFPNQSNGILKNSTVVLYCGKKKYFTPPYTNSKGFDLLEKMKTIIAREMNEN